MSLKGRLEAKARGDVATAELLAFGGANSDAYDLLDSMPPEGTARLCAWCAFVLQTYADKMLSSGSTEGYASEPACEQARTLYELAREWLERAQQAAADPAYVLDAVVPQPLPRPPDDPPEGDQVAGMRAALEAVQARAGAELEARPGDPVVARLNPVLAAVQSALDAAIVSKSPGPELRAPLSRTLADGLDRAYTLGQLLAVPTLLATPAAQPVAPAVASAPTIGMFLPGDPAFDPWCLTDPLERARLAQSASAADELESFWKSDPDPAQTLAIQAAIATAIAHGAADYLPADVSDALEALCQACPWPGVLLAKETLSIGDAQIGRGEAFVLEVGGSGETFRRGIAKASPA